MYLHSCLTDSENPNYLSTNAHFMKPSIYQFFFFTTFTFAQIGFFLAHFFTKNHHIYSFLMLLSAMKTHSLIYINILKHVPHVGTCTYRAYNKLPPPSHTNTHTHKLFPINYVVFTMDKVF